jgi:DNA-binding MarR family transcriptional regulator
MTAIRIGAIQMASERAWRVVNGKLANASGDEFERTAIHYLRVIWPAMVQAPRLLRLDRLGVDLCVPAEDTVYEVVVQAKGFKVDEQLLESQVNDQILPSIEKFRKSALTCNEYVLLHNRDGADRQLAKKVQDALDVLVAEGKAKSARLWDRHAFVKEVRNELDRRIRVKLTDRSQRFLRQHQEFFRFGNVCVASVPLCQSSWKPASVTRFEFSASDFSDVDAAKLIASPRKVRYSLLVGAFGIGKTTTVLRAADAKDLQVIYVPAHTIPREHGSQGTNYLLRNINDELELLDDLPSETIEVLNDVMGAALGRVLRQPGDQFALVIDGLDEHYFYGSAQGLMWLTNELSELRCPIVLTTRKEHLLATAGNYEVAMQSLSKKGGADRTVDVIELGPWSSAHAEQLLRSVLVLGVTEDQASSIRTLLDLIASGSSTISARLLSHPLFLQMTLDLIMDGEEWLIDDEDELIGLWVRRKIQRDLSVRRLPLNFRFDVEHYVEGMIESMSRVAMKMQMSDGDTAMSSEVIAIEAFSEIARKEIGLPDLDEATLVSTSLLVPATRRRGRILEVKFFHRAFQEYFVRRGSMAIG